MAITQQLFESPVPSYKSCSAALFAQPSFRASSAVPPLRSTSPLLLLFCAPGGEPWPHPWEEGMEWQQVEERESE